MGWQNAGGWQVWGWGYAVAAGADSAAATNFLARTSGLDASHTSAYKTLLNGLTTDGFFDGSGNSTKLDGLWVFATQDQTTANLNMVKAGASYGPCTTSGTPTWTANAGYSAMSNTSFVQANLNLSTLAGNASQNSWHLSTWNNATTTSTFGTIVDTADAAKTGHIFAKFSDGNAYFRIGDSGAAGVAVANPQGFYHGNRSGAASWEGYKNGSQITAGTDASSALPNGTITWPAANAVTAQQAETASILLAGSAGVSLNATDASNLYSRLHTFLQTIAGIP